MLNSKEVSKVDLTHEYSKVLFKDFTREFSADLSPQTCFELSKKLNPFEGIPRKSLRESLREFLKQIVK